MLTRYDLPSILEEALDELGGEGSIISVCKIIWDKYEEKLRASGDLFYTWQYDVRWAATYLRDNKIMKSYEESPYRVWQLTKASITI